MLSNQINCLNYKTKKLLKDICNLNSKLPQTGSFTFRQNKLNQTNTINFSEIKNIPVVLVNVLNQNECFDYIYTSNVTNSSFDIVTTSNTSVCNTTVDNSGSVGQDTSLQVVNGNPAISYYDATNTALKYVRALDVSGNTENSWFQEFAVKINWLIQN